MLSLGKSTLMNNLIRFPFDLRSVRFLSVEARRCETGGFSQIDLAKRQNMVTLATVDLPAELWYKILQQVPFSTNLLLVSKQWQQAMYGRNELVIKVNKKVKETGLMQILNMFTSLKTLRFEVGHSYSPSLHHEIALQFTGMPTILQLESISDYVIYGAQKCSKLISLSLPVLQEGSRFAIETQPWRKVNVLLQRDLGYILDSNPTLKSLRLDSPVCDRFIEEAIISNLESLCLTSMYQSVIQMFSRNLVTKIKFPYLKELSLDLDYSPLPQLCLERIAIACPQIQHMRIKYGHLSDGFLPTLCDKFKNLESLRLTRCDIPSPAANWADIITHTSGSLTKLKVLHFKNCFLVGESTFQLQKNGKMNSKLRVLKVFDIHEGRIDEAAFLRILKLFPCLENLRMDLGTNCFPGPSKEYGEEVYMYIRLVSKLELRFGKPHGDPEKVFNETQPYLYLPNLKHLVIAGSFTFPDFLIKPNEKHIQTLSLDYAMVGPNPDTKYDMRKLKTFSIRAISHLAESICLSSATALLRNSLQLQKLNIHSSSHKGAEFDNKSLHILIKNCPNLKTFSTMNLKFRLNSLKSLVSAWPLLEQLEVSGGGAAGPLNQEFECLVLKPLVRNHTCLKSLILGVSGLSVRGDNEDGFVADDSFTKNYPYLVGASRYGAFRSYESHLKKSFPKIEFTIRGPIEDAFRLQRR